jgi:hypothetical protein
MPSFKPSVRLSVFSGPSRQVCIFVRSAYFIALGRARSTVFPNTWIIKPDSFGSEVRTTGLLGSRTPSGLQGPIGTNYRAPSGLWGGQVAGLRQDYRAPRVSRTRTPWGKASGFFGARNYQSGIRVPHQDGLEGRLKPLPDLIEDGRAISLHRHHVMSRRT